MSEKKHTQEVFSETLLACEQDLASFFSPVCLDRRLYSILRGLKSYHSVLIPSSFSVISVQVIEIWCWNFQIEKRSNKVGKGQPLSRQLNCWSNSRLGEVDQMSPRDLLEVSKFKSISFSSTEVKLNRLNGNKNTTGFLTWKLTVNLNNMSILSMFLKAGENSLLIQPSCFVYICLVYLGLRFGSWSRSQTIQREWTNPWSTDVSFFFYRV